MILAIMTVRCPSNDLRASSTSGPLSPVAQTIAGRDACSCLPWPVVLPRWPHRPSYSNRWPGHPSTHPQPLLFCGDGSLTPQPNQSTLILVSTWASTIASSPAPRRPLPRPCHHPPPWWSPRGMVNVVKEQLPSEEYCT